jgi:hypothetical protein
LQKVLYEVLPILWKNPEAIFNADLIDNDCRMVESKACTTKLFTAVIESSIM